MIKTLYIVTNNGKPYNGYTNPEESIDDHPLLRETIHVFTITEMITMYNVICYIRQCIMLCYRILTQPTLK